MNIQKRPHAICVVSLLLALTLVTGCSSDPIFSAIENEVAIKDPTMTGTITSLEVIDGSIYATNGYIYKRTNGVGDWNKIALPSGASRCSEIASDGTNLYGRFTNSDWTSFNSIQMYNTSTGAWTKVTGASSIVLIGDGDGRIYAFTGADDVYNLYVTPSAGSTALGGTAIATGLTTPTSTAGNFVSTNAYVYYCDGSSLAVAGGTSPTGVTGITVATVGGTTSLYAVNSGYVWRFNGTTASGSWTDIAHDLSTPTTNIAYLGGTKNLLLIASGSTTGGFCEVVLGSTGALSSVISEPGDSSASSVAPADQDQYESTIYKWALYRIFAVTGAVPSGDAYVLYASVIHYSYNGLWSYYPTTDSEWNRE